MSMIHCRGCGKQIHESAPVCPHCGAPQGISPGAVAMSAPLPPGIAGWSWGAFLFNWLWAAFNSVWIGLLALVPFVGFVMAIVLGMKGREWAWRAKPWESVEHFQRVQRRWSAWGICVVLGSMLISIVSAVALPAYQEYTKRARQQAVILEKQRQQIAAAEAESVRAAAQTELAQAAANKQAQRAVAMEPTPAAVPTPPAAPEVANPSASQPDLLAAAKQCKETSLCMQAMLRGAYPRRADVIQVAVQRLNSISKPEAGDRKVARDLNRKALERFTASDYAGAAGLLQQASVTDPRDAEIKSNLGLAFVKMGRTAEAFTALAESLEIDPQRSAAWAPLAEALDQERMRNESFSALLLTYEFSSNRTRTLSFFRSRIEDPAVSESLRATYTKALQTIEAGY